MGHSKLKAQCVVDMVDAVSEERGEDIFSDWAITLCLQGEKYSFSDASPGVYFMSRDAVMTLYELLSPLQISSHIDQQGFLDMLQQVGEHMNLMNLMSEELDDLVPADVVHAWMKSFIRSYVNLYRELDDLEQPKRDDVAARCGGNSAFR